MLAVLAYLTRVDRAQEISESSLTSECLRLRRAPPDSCTDEWTTDGCLRSPLPFRIPYVKVEACFRCCVLNATAPLRANAAFWRRVWLAESRDPWGAGAGKAPGAIGRLLGFDEDASVLLTALSGARHADAGATYANATLMTAPLWRRRHPMYTYIHGWTPQAAAAMSRWWRVHPVGPHVLYTSGAQPLPERSDLRRLRGSAAVRMWWVTNPAVAHPRISAFPRGVKLSSRWHAALRSARYATLSDPEDRPTLLFCSCMSLKTHAQRAHKLASLRANGFACESNSDLCSTRGAESDYYVRQLFNARFTASPRGAGQQNHRDWEALLAGSVALIDHEPLLEELYAGLPVVMVQNWSAITPAFLRATWREMAGRKWEWAKLYFPYWLDRLGITGRRTAPAEAVATGERSDMSDTRMMAENDLVTPRETMSDRPMVRIGVSLIGPTPVIVQEAWRTWLPPSTPQAHSGDVEDPDHHIWYVERQHSLAGVWSGNHDADNRALKQVLLANRTLAGQFDWLVLADFDTCLDLARLAEALAGIDASKKFLLGVPFTPTWCDENQVPGPDKGCCAGKQRSPEQTPPGLFRDIRSRQCCSDGSALRGQECRLRQRTASERAVPFGTGVGLRRPPVWYYGGSGGLLSRGLLDGIRPNEWLRCYQDMRAHGGDVRVSSCVFTHTGIALTELIGLRTASLSAHKSCLTARANASLASLATMHRRRTRRLGRRRAR